MNTLTPKNRITGFPFDLYPSTAMYISIPQKKASINMPDRLSSSFTAHIPAAARAVLSLVKDTRVPVVKVPHRFPNQTTPISAIYASGRPSAYPILPV